MFTVKLSCRWLEDAFGKLASLRENTDFKVRVHAIWGNGVQLIAERQNCQVADQ
jgi:hypothetical protein